jgi:fatty acid desaturase
VKRTRRSSPDGYLLWKVAIFFLAAGVWLAGVISGRAWLSGAAIVVLLLALVLRFLPHDGDEDATES